ncbi:MAG TPA: hypothetical protein VHO04_02305 [Sphingopyxis sp.]|uniref:hypothetical protein n=1 Tax=Sphingopyxis sp. TaxID=1908224 RepID=UPI002E2EA577|nr:hypothetical protein [Sphingopyxis sp.]HEX2811489.1 hypothetical protein [Sphingopyxis sp.]
MSFSYDISLQVRHPDADPNDIVRGVGLPVKRSWAAGEPRSTPRGTALSGHRDASYCAFDLGAGDDGELAERLRAIVATLVPKQDFLLGLRATGGSINLFITWTVGERGEMFDCSLLSGLARLGIDLGIEPVRAD